MLKRSPENQEIEMEVLLTILGVFLIALPIRFVAGICDYDRVREYLEDLNYEIVRMKWDPFGSGWWGSRSRIYELHYFDDCGDLHRAQVKTAAWAGVYLTNDVVVHVEQNIPDFVVGQSDSSDRVEGSSEDTLDYRRSDP